MNATATAAGIWTLDTARTPLSVPELAQVLFASPLQMSQAPSPTQVRTAINGQLTVRHRGLADWAAYVAQEAGDHPESYAARMHWALDAVSHAYSPTQQAAA